MTVQEFCEILKQNPDKQMHWMLPDNAFVPEHYHITEVGKIQKDFIDCGGTKRSKQTCQLQIWTANDIEHRLETNKLFDILKIAGDMISDDLQIEIEYEDQTVSQYPIAHYQSTPKGPLFILGSKHTTCLAPDKCGIQCGEGCC